MRKFFAILAFTAFGPCFAMTTPFSQYGQIQNVQSYSSNPFWNPNGPYNQRMPQAVYVTGPDITSGDCQRVVSALVANTCATMDNCRDAVLSDIRPTVMLQLSRLPGHNYATACGGYIDTEFDKYIANIDFTGTQTAFPNATIANPSASQNGTINMPNPMARPTPQWKSDMIERAQELQELQSRNGAGTEQVVSADFPVTVGDLSFQERMNNLATGYEPYLDKSAYQPMNILYGQKSPESNNATTSTNNGGGGSHSNGNPQSFTEGVSPTTSGKTVVRLVLQRHKVNQ